MRIKRRTIITIRRSTHAEIPIGGGVDRRICSVCNSASAAIPPDRAETILSLTRDEIEGALRSGEVHAAGPEGLCAASLVRLLPGLAGADSGDIFYKTKGEKSSGA
jgi:hypothetical protein